MSMLKGNEDEYVDSARTRIRFVLGCVAGVSAVLLVLLLTFMTNKKPAKEQKVTSGKVNLSAAEDGEIPLSELESDGKRVSDELNFWHMYDEPKDESTVIPTARPAGQDDRVYREDGEDEEESWMEDEAAEGVSENSLSENEAALSENQADVRVAVSENLFDVNQLSDGAAMFAEVESGIKPNPYLKDAFRMDGQWKDYAPLGKKSSFRGIDVSKYQKTIDWGRVAASGIDFAMLRMGSRGYGSGKVSIDDEFRINLDGCSVNGIHAGVYFYSQAVNVMEAVEEANYCIAAIQGHEVTYPIVFDTEEVLNDSYRTQFLTKQEMSAIARAFCDTVKAYGYTPMIGATKKQFAYHLDLSLIQDYDWWLFDTDEETVFPYRFTMWQYSQSGTVDGINGAVDLDLSIVDYSMR